MNAPFQIEGTRILLVDEDRDLVHGLARILRLRGYSVDEAVGEREAMLLAREHCPRIVFLNCSNHDLNGMEARRQIQDVCPEATLVITVATEHELQQIRATGTPVFRKPFDVSALLDELHTLEKAQDKLHLPS